MRKQLSFVSTLTWLTIAAPPRSTLTHGLVSCCVCWQLPPCQLVAAFPSVILEASPPCAVDDAVAYLPSAIFLGLELLAEEKSYHVL